MEDTIHGRPLIAGNGAGEILWSDTGLSFWGGVDAVAGTVIDCRHPLYGQRLTGRILCLPQGKGSCSSSGILLEMIRARTAPAAILAIEMEGTLSIGAVIGRELYGRTVPICIVTSEEYHVLSKGHHAEITVDGSINFE